jgi:pimeloyl-ACP methyl ester carboxylesterase
VQREAEILPFYYFDKQMTTENVIRLGEDGIALAEYGNPAGIPVVFCHGWPSSCTMAELTDAAARQIGVRIISPDRPGISGSALPKERKLLDWPPLLRGILEHLGIGEFRMLAISGGAPYAYATAWAMPRQIRAIAIVSGVPPIHELQKHDGLLALHRWMLALYRVNPELLRMFFHAARPFISMRASIRVARGLVRLLQPCDAESLRDSVAFNACFESQRRAWRGSAEGVMMDAKIYADSWGFALEDINVPVRLWHGRNDRTFSVQLAEEVARRLPNCSARYIDNAGHYSLPIRNMRAILADVISV